MRNLWQAFAAQVAAAPGSPALVFAAETVSFADLNALACTFAEHLAGLGIGRGQVVALQLPKRKATYALLLACLRLGAPYVFIDTKNPEDRSARIIATLRPALVITSGNVENPFGAVLYIGAGGELAWPAERTQIPDGNVVGTDPAYVMFTSGSTGEPKGAVIPHQGVLSLMEWARQAQIAQPGERFTAINPLHFDNSVFDIYCGLLSGAALIPVETSEVSNPASWVRTVRESGATVMFAVPTLFLILDQLGLLTPKALPTVRTFQFGGEGFPIGKLRDFHARFAGKARLVNVYGPTETSCICSSVTITDETLDGPDTEFPPLGRMHRDFTYAILDESLQAVPRGEPGELWIGGPCVGLGYYANPAETSARFRQDPRQQGYRSIFYRSGDIVREDKQSRLWFHGRADNQVKIRGHRIELEEIDLAVQSVAGVRRALAAVIKTPDGDEIGVAFMADQPIAADTIHATCRDRLPAYMRPARLVQLADLPRNANDKVDRKAVKALLQQQEPA
jgi:D-alanine--poly(phosphoribitol) ligase subunit 1